MQKQRTVFETAAAEYAAAVQLTAAMVDDAVHAAEKGQLRVRPAVRDHARELQAAVCAYLVKNREEVAKMRDGGADEMMVFLHQYELKNAIWFALIDMDADGLWIDKWNTALMDFVNP